MNKDEKKPYKRVSSDEQAYDDLLSFYSSDTKPQTFRALKHSKCKGSSFKTCKQ